MNRLISLLFVVCLSTSLFAQDEIAKAKSLIRDGNCADAVSALQGFTKAKFRTHAGAQAAVMLTECYLRDHRRDEAMQLSSKFLEYHISSEYRERMELAHAIVMVEQGAVYEGVENMLRILAYSKNPAARSRTKEVAVQTLAFAPDNAKAIAAALRGRNNPDAIVCGNDERAAILSETLQSLGKRIPDDVAVIGFDNSAHATRSRPPLTTVSQPVDKLAATAFKVLLARIRYPDNEPRETYLGAPLVVRAST